MNDLILMLWDFRIDFKTNGSMAILNIGDYEKYHDKIIGIIRLRKINVDLNKENACLY